MAMNAIASKTLLLGVFLRLIQRAHVHKHKVHLALVFRVRCQRVQLFGRRATCWSEILVEVHQSWQRRCCHQLGQSLFFRLAICGPGLERKFWSFLADQLTGGLDPLHLRDLTANHEDAKRGDHWQPTRDLRANHALDINPQPRSFRLHEVLHQKVYAQSGEMCRRKHGRHDDFGLPRRQP